MNIEQIKYDEIILNIDNENSEDKNEVIYSKRMLETLLDFDPLAEDDLKIACYGQHIKRFAYPRTDYPEGRAGYLKWRKELYTIHANLVESCILKADGSEQFAESVKNIMVNKVTGKGKSQTFEDVACLVFLKYYFSDFVVKHEESKLITIIQKTWNKMSDKAHEAALKFDFTDEQMELLKKALSL